MPLRFLFAILILSSVPGSFPAFAQDDDLLYDPEPPPGASFVRIIHGALQVEPVQVIVGPTHFDTISYSQASPYRVVKQGSHRIETGTSDFPFEVDYGEFYSVVLTGSLDDPEWLILKDKMISNRARALLALYNLSELENLDLKTADGQISVLTEVTPGGVKSMLVNPIKVDLAVFQGDHKLQIFNDLRLVRGAAYSVLVLGSKQDASTVWIQSRTKLD